ncbi:MAG: tetratricopeptide repeat protein [Chloroflexota bacterium]
MTNLDTLNSRKDFVGKMIGQGLNHLKSQVDSSSDPSFIHEIRDRLTTMLHRAFQFKVHEHEAIFLIESVSPLMESTGYWGVWQKLLAHAITLAEEMEEYQLLASLHHYHARILFRLSQTKSGEAAYLKAIRLSRRLKDAYNEARACTNLGYNYIDHGHWWRSEVLCLHALQIFEKLDSDHGKAHARNNLGLLYIRQQKWHEAGQSLDKAKEIWNNRQDGGGLMHVYVNLGLLFIEKKEADMALYWSTKALEQANKIQDTYTLGHILNNISIAHRLKHDYAKAKANIDLAREKFARNSDYLGTARADGNTAWIELELGNFEKSVVLFTKALAMYEQLQNGDGIAVMLENLTQCYLSLGNIQKAQLSLTRLEAIKNQYHWGKQRYQQLSNTTTELEAKLT